jgi:uncharacterized spore protein YtfJ
MRHIVICGVSGYTNFSPQTTRFFGWGGGLGNKFLEIKYILIVSTIFVILRITERDKIIEMIVGVLTTSHTQFA